MNKRSQPAQVGSNAGLGVVAHRDDVKAVTDLKGENAVLAGLLRDCDAVLATIEADDGEEAQKLGDLRMALVYALDPYKREGALL